MRMSLIRFARMSEAIEQQDRTVDKIRIIDESLNAFKDPHILLEILSLEYDVNNIGQKRAITWIANSFGMFEDEVKTQADIWGDLSEGMMQFLSDEFTVDSNISLKEFHSLLVTDCSSINSDAYTVFNERTNDMSALELKWFLRYWLRNPRNGIGGKAVARLLKRRFPNSDIDKYAKFHSPIEIYRYLSNGNEPPCMTGVGKFIPCSLAKKHQAPYKLPNDYLIDVKYDGNRYQIHRDRDSVIIFNRKGKIVTYQYPDVVDLVKTFNAHNFILDTEIYPVVSQGSDIPAEHKKLATRVHSKDIEKAVEDCPVHMVIFDILHYMNVSLIEQRYRERLIHLPDFPSWNRVRAYTDGDIEIAYNNAINDGFEGIMIKDLNASYQAGKRTEAMLKHKPPRIDLDVVITSAQYGDGKRRNVFGTFGISVLDSSSSSGYKSVGSVGTGLSDGDLAYLTTELKKVVEKYSGDTFYILPRIVLEVTCDVITQDSEGEYGLRFPRVVKIRNDKFPKDCNSILDIQMMS